MVILAPLTKQRSPYAKGTVDRDVPLAMKAEPAGDTLSDPTARAVLRKRLWTAPDGTLVSAPAEAHDAIVGPDCCG